MSHSSPPEIRDKGCPACGRLNVLTAEELADGELCEACNYGDEDEEEED